MSVSPSLLAEVLKQQLQLSGMRPSLSVCKAQRWPILLHQARTSRELITASLLKAPREMPGHLFSTARPPCECYGSKIPGSSLRSFASLFMNITKSFMGSTSLHEGAVWKLVPARARMPVACASVESGPTKNYWLNILSLQNLVKARDKHMHLRCVLGSIGRMGMPGYGPLCHDDL